MTVDEVQLVLAHECGHILCHHPLYNMMIAAYDSGFAKFLPMLPRIDRPLLYAWKRASEFSADRAMLAFAGNPEKAMRVIIRLSAGGHRFTNNINIDVYKKQIEEYYALSQTLSLQSMMQKFLKILSFRPFASIRSHEFTKWSKTPKFSLLSRKIGTYDPRCPKCGAAMQRNTNICVNGHFS